LEEEVAGLVLVERGQCLRLGLLDEEALGE
jgi:hypothetical protein